MSIPGPQGTSSVLEPEEPMLVKYSKQHEFGFSTMVSVGTHVLVALIAFAAGAAFWSWNSDRDLPEYTNIEVVPPTVGDGRKGGGGRAGLDLTNTEPEQPPLEHPADQDSLLPPLPELDDGKSHVQAKDLRTAEAKSRQVSKGKGGGAGGGKGTGIGKDEGGGTGGDGIRYTRMKRWEISVTYASGEDYLRKLGNLGAKIGIPQGNGTLAVYSNLDQRPLKSEPYTSVQIERLNWLYWANDDPNAVPALAEAMGLSLPPKRLYVFFPKDLEAELVKKEMAHSGLTEQQLNKQGYYTTFRAERQGTKWVIAVIKQEKRK